MDTNLKILLVEDAGVMRKLEGKALKSLGFTDITEAENGQDAITKMEAGLQPDLIISDWNMPEKDGYELLVWVRSQEQFKATPFMMATGRGEKKEVAKATEAGVNSFIAKPFNAEELRLKIEEALGLSVEEEVADREEERHTESGKVKLKLAHIQITDHLALGVLKHLIASGELKPKHFELETTCMPSWNPVAEALEKKTVDGAFILAPLAMDIFGYGADIRLVLFAHKNGSIFVRNKKGVYEEPFSNFFTDKSFLIPHVLSIHNMLAHMFFSNIGLRPGFSGEGDINLNLEVLAPIKMPESLGESESNSGYLVAEPLGTKAIANGLAELQFLSSELWENHPCCVVTMQKHLIEKYPDAVSEFTEMLVQAGKYIEQKPALSAEIAVKFLDPEGKLGLKVPILKNVLTDPKGITFHDLWPMKDDLKRIQEYMVEEMKIGSKIDVDEFVDLQFAEKAIPEDKRSVASTNLKDPVVIANEILNRSKKASKADAEKALLNKEGKYLLFDLNDQHFGLDILRIIEISKITQIRSIPEAPAFVKGVINFRGHIVPVINPKNLFGMSETEQSTDKKKQAFTIILESHYNNDHLLVGLAVDSVTEILNIKATDIEEAPSYLMNEEANYILALAKLNGNVKILVDIDKILDKRIRQVVGQMYDSD